MKNKKLYQVALSGLFLAVALVLPFITGQIPQIGKALCPMHLPVLLCGFFCGPLYGLLVGAIAPILRSVLFGTPVLFPSGISMCFELATYGFVVGVCYLKLPKKVWTVFVSLIIAMIAGRIVMGIANVILYNIKGSTYGIQAYLAGAFVNSVWGIVLQLVLVPTLVIALKKYTLRDVE